MRRLMEILLGVAMLCGALYTAKQNLDYAQHAIKVMGSVVQVTNRVEIDDDSWSHSQSPVVEFLPRGASAKRRFRSSIWTHALFAPKTGEQLPVQYLENEPENARVASWMHWLMPIVLLIVGIATLMGWTTSKDTSRFGFRWNSD